MMLGFELLQTFLERREGLAECAAGTAKGVRLLGFQYAEQVGIATHLIQNFHGAFPPFRFLKSLSGRSLRLCCVRRSTPGPSIPEGRAKRALTYFPLSSPPLLDAP